MNKHAQEDNSKKIIAFILYLASRTQQATFMSIAKLMYFADLMYLNRTGRTISGDQYIAMQHGPVPEIAYGLLRDSRDNEIYGWRVVGDYFVEAVDEPDYGCFSRVELNCLQLVVLKYGDLPTWYLRHLSHDSAWQSTWRQAQEYGRAAEYIKEETLLEMINNEINVRQL